MYDSFLAFQERVPDTHDSSPKMTEAILDAGKEVIISVPYNIELKKKKLWVSSLHASQSNVVQWADGVRSVLQSPCPSLLQNPGRIPPVNPGQ